MDNTIFETLKRIIDHSNSANAILYYIENKKWFKGCRVSNGYAIPYPKWRAHTLIPIEKIGDLSSLISDGKGQIYYEDNVVHICESDHSPFQSRLPRQHIEYICHKYKSAHVLKQYLEEFYCYEILKYKYRKSRIVYSIPYELWFSLFEMPPETIIELGAVITRGYLCLGYNIDKVFSVNIYI